MLFIVCCYSQCVICVGPLFCVMVLGALSSLAEKEKAGSFTLIVL